MLRKSIPIAGGDSYGGRWSRAKRETTGFPEAPNSDRGSGRGANSRRLVFDPRLLPESNRAAHMNPAVARFARTAGYRTSRHPATWILAPICVNLRHLRMKLLQLEFGA